MKVVGLEDSAGSGGAAATGGGGMGLLVTRRLRRTAESLRIGRRWEMYFPSSAGTRRGIMGTRNQYRKMAARTCSGHRFSLQFCADGSLHSLPRETWSSRREHLAAARRQNQRSRQRSILITRKRESFAPHRFLREGSSHPGEMSCWKCHFGRLKAQT